MFSLVNPRVLVVIAFKLENFPSAELHTIDTRKRHALP
jgi:hypothetical protein